MKALLILLTLTLAACQSTDQQARSLLDRLEFDEGEEGCFRLTGTLDLNPIPLASSNITLNLVKRKGESVDC